MKRSGIRTKLRGIITCPGLWPGIEANIIPIAEKPREDKAIQASKAPPLAIWDPKKATPTRMGIMEIPMPKTTPASVLPMRTERRETGEVRNRSKVWLARSLGVTTGPMDDGGKERGWAMGGGI